MAILKAAKDSTVRYHTDQSGASGSYYIFFRSGVYNCMRLISAFCNLLTSSPRTRLQLAYDVQGSRPGVIMFFFVFFTHFSFRVSRVRVRVRVRISTVRV